VAGALAALVLVCLAPVVVGLTSADADARPRVGVAVPADALRGITSAAAACPTLTRPRLAGQLMANSGLNPKATRAGGRSGIAGLTEADWRQWSPWPGATRSGIQDNIVALAHQMCGYVGELRSANIGGDQWPLALASFAVGMSRVRAVGGVPAGTAADYVVRVESYTQWYEHQGQFGGTGGPGTTSAYTTIQAESYTAQSGTGAEACTDAGCGRDIGKLTPGDWLKYKVDFGSVGATRFLVRFASDLPAGARGVIEVRLDTVGSTPVGGVAVARTGGWQNWITVLANLSRVTGVHTVYLTFTSTSGWGIGNINWFTFQ
jgi:hypothetical protein